MASFRVLGPVEALDDGEPVALGGRRQITLLVFLLVHANEAVSSDALTEAVWGSARGTDNRLPMAIARLRRALPGFGEDAGSRLRTVGGGYLLSIEPDELDAHRFAEHVAAGRSALDADDPAAACEELDTALGLWRGPPLAEVAFEDFAQPEIRRLEELRLVALETRVDARLRLGDENQLIGELEGLLAENPTRERLAAQLMLALYRSGRQAEALQVYQRVRAHLAEALGLEPGPALKALQTQIFAQAPSLALGGEDPGSGVSSQRSRLARLPLPSTPTIGREHEVQTVRALLAKPAVRVVTLTGPGGVGKTRLALAAAHVVSASYEDGACWVELAGVMRPDDVGATILRALAVTPVDGETSRDALIRYLSGKRLLLVIDNFEHVIGAAELVGALVGAGERLTVLVTSREALDLSAEHRVSVEPLSLPGLAEDVSVAQVNSAPATAMFLDAARRRDSRFAITEAHAPVVARICAKLDGLPLALELAAARTRLLAVDELEAELGASWTSIGTGPRDAPMRHRTLEAMIDWSYDLLDEEQRAAFVSFAVFLGGATLDAARTVTGAAPSVLEELVAKSLFDRREQPDGATRLVMLDTIRHYALQRLNDDPRRDAIRRLHLDYFRGLVERTIPRLTTHEDRAALRALDDETDNIRSAFRWALTAAPADALRLAGQLGEYWWVRADPNALAWTDAALRAVGEDASPADRARALLNRSSQLVFRHQLAAAGQAGEAALALYQEIDDNAGISDAYRGLAFFYTAAGDTNRGGTCAQAACRHARLTGDDARLGQALATLVSTSQTDQALATLQQAAQLLMPFGNWRPIARAYNNLGFVALKQGRPPQAIELLDVALRLIEQHDSPPDLMITCGNIGLANLFTGNISRARAAFARQLRICAGQAYRRGADEGLAGIAAIAASNAQAEQAARLLGAARAMGYPGTDLTDQAMYDRLEREFFAPARASYGTDAWHRAEVAGAALSYEQALADALAETSPTGDEVPSPAADSPTTMFQPTGRAGG